MSYSYYYHNPNISPKTNYPQFKAGVTDVVTKPTEAIANVIETGVDTFVKEDDVKKKKKRKKIIYTASSVLVLGAIVALLNPKMTSKFSNKLKNIQQQAKLKKLKNNDNPVTKFYHATVEKVSGLTQNIANALGNANSWKDGVFKSMCTNRNKKYYSFITKNEGVYKAVKKVDNGFVNLMEKPHKAITNWFDKLGKFTVNTKYHNSGKKLDSLELILKEYRKKLPADKQRLVDLKLEEIARSRAYFSKEQTAERFANQENLMKDIETDFWKLNDTYFDLDNPKNNSFGKVMKNLFTRKTSRVKGSDYWVQDALQSKKIEVEKQGQNAVEKLIGNGKDKKGLYDEVIDLMDGYITKEELAVYQKNLNKAGTSLKKANNSECIDYFDKKRDLIMGGAPTDILTAIGGLGLCGLAVARADNKEERQSRLLTAGVPVVLGFGSSLALAGALVSGPVGLAVGAAISVITGIGCDMLNKRLFGDKDELTPEEQLAQNKKTKVVKNA